MPVPEFVIARRVGRLLECEELLEGDTEQLGLGEALRTDDPAQALTAIFHQGTYRNADAFIAFVGMDVRVRQSRRWKGKSKLTKKGDPEVRRLLFNAAMQARRNPLWEPYYLALRERGFSTTAAVVALGRKLARVAFALLQKNVDFDPQLHTVG